MQVLTPSGYRDAASLVEGDAVCAFDETTGAPIVNHVESVEWVDPSVFESWQNPRFLVNGTLTLFGLHSYPTATGSIKQIKQVVVGDTLTLFDGSHVAVASISQIDPNEPWTFFLINGTHTLNRQQSIWRNSGQVCHASDLVVGDTIFDDANNPVTITSIATTTAPGWYRFEIDGDHSYIADGLTLHNASRFWVGNGGTWDLSTTTHWASSTGGGGGSSAPGSGDSVTIDGSGGSGTITPSFGGSGTFQSITCGAMGMTLDFTTNNDSVTLNSTTGFSGTGSGTRTINLGNGTWTLSSGNGSNVWNFSTTTNLTFNANSSTITFSQVTNGTRTFIGGGKSYNTINVSANSSGGCFAIQSSNTIATFGVSAPNCVSFNGASTTTVTNALNITATAGNLIFLSGATIGTSATVSSANNGAFTYCGIRDMTFSGGGTFTATSSFDFGHNSGVTITQPPSPGFIIG